MAEMHKCPNCGQHIYLLKDTEDVYTCDICMKVFVEVNGILKPVSKDVK